MFYQIACTHDSLGKERDAIPAYEKCIVRQLAETSGDDSIQTYRRALLFYSDKLSEIFE